MTKLTQEQNSFIDEVLLKAADHELTEAEKDEIIAKRKKEVTIPSRRIAQETSDWIDSLLIKGSEQ